MNFLKRLGLLVYMVLMIGTGVLLLLVSLKIIAPENWTSMMNVVYSSLNCKLTVGFMGGIFVLIGTIVPFRLSKEIRRGRMMTFQNPDGEVTVSIPAIEDYVRKIANDMHDVKDVRAHVSVSKRGINVVTAVSINAGANIPDVMERIQVAVKNRIRGMLGVEEQINIKMHISRIIGTLPPEAPAAEEEKEPPQAPLR